MFTNFLFNIAKLISPEVAQLEADLEQTREELAITNEKLSVWRDAANGAQQAKDENARLTVELENTSKTLLTAKDELGLLNGRLEQIKAFANEKSCWSLFDLIDIESKVRAELISQGHLTARSKAKVMDFGPSTEKLITEGWDVRLRTLEVTPARPEWTGIVETVTHDVAKQYPNLKYSVVESYIVATKSTGCPLRTSVSFLRVVE